MRQRNATVSVVGLVILVCLIAWCMMFGNTTSKDIAEDITVADKFMSVWQDAVPIGDDVVFENISASYYGSLTKPLSGCLAIFEVCDNNDLIVFLSEYGSRVRLRINNGYVYHGESAIFTIDEMTDGVLTLCPVRAEKIDDNAYRMVVEGDAEMFVSDMT